MHSSLIREIRDKYLSEMPSPPCDIIDIHMHVGNKIEDRKYYEIAREFGVKKAGAMLHGCEPEELINEYTDFFFPIAWLDMPDSSSGKDWVKNEISRINSLYTRGLKGIKLRSACKEGRPEIWIDNELILDVLQEFEDSGLLLYIHIADPSIWWGDKFVVSEVGEKIIYHRPVEKILKRLTGMKVIGAHMGGYPEDFSLLSYMLDTYKNYYLDTSATKWIIRELGRKVAETRDFMIKYQDRICFGSDLVTFLSAGQEDYYRSRLWVLRSFFEKDYTVPSMIFDPDAIGKDYPEGPEVRGLGLDFKVLSKIYSENAAKLLGW